MKRYKDLKREKLLKKLREHSPRLPFLNLYSASSSNSPVNVWKFFFKRTWNSTLREIIRILETMVENKSPKYDLRHSTIYGFAPETKGSSLVSGQNIHNNEIVKTKNSYQSEQKQSLAEAATEIQQLLEQLEQSYPTKTLSEQAIVVEETIKQIEANKDWKQKVINAVKAMGIEAFMEMIDNPVANVLRAGIESLLEEDSD